METHHAHHDHPDADADLAELLELDAQVLHSYLSDVTSWVRRLAGELPVRRVLDLGCGTGNGTFALARCFEAADLIALDQSTEMLGRLEIKARQLGLADRIRTLQADLDLEWPGIDPVDVVWASNSLHHLADPDRVLAKIFTTIRPGGILAVAELGSFPRFLPDDIGLGQPGLEARCHAAVAGQMAHSLPHLGSDWSPRLRRAGFTVAAEQPFVINLTPPLPASTGRYARASLQRIRSGLHDQLTADDLAALDTLISSTGPDGVLRRDDLTVRALRTAWVARRP
jgi:SAM-dependent methyltransferase